MQDSPIVLTTLAGLSTGLGGLLAVLCPPSERLLAASAGFAGGVMLTASLADLMPEALAFYGGYLPPLACGLCIHYSRHISNVHSITCFLSASINPTLQELVHFAPVLSGTFITFTSSKQDVRNYSSFYTRIDPLTSIKCTSRQHVLPVRAGFAQMSNVW